MFSFLVADLLRKVRALLVDERRNGLKYRYPWDEWLDGHPWKLRRGEDFDTSIASMRAIASKAARSEGMTLRTQATKDDDGAEVLIIQALTRKGR
jgi:hypothetical protein